MTGRPASDFGAARLAFIRLALLRLAFVGLVLIAMGAAETRAEPVDEVIEALKIREYLLASEAQCRNAAQGQAKRHVAASVAASLPDQALSTETQARLDRLGQTYAREACRLGIDEGLMQSYRAAYRAAMSDGELTAVLDFLNGPTGKKFAAAGLAANRKILPMIARRQESQASRAGALLRSRLASLLAELSQGAQ